MVSAALCRRSSRVIPNSLWKIPPRQSTTRCLASSKDPPSGGSKGGGNKKGSKNDSGDKKRFHIQRPFEPLFGPKSHKFLNNNGPINPYKRYGGTYRNLKLVKDSSQFAILIPGRSVDSEFFDRDYNNNNNGNNDTSLASNHADSGEHMPPPPSSSSFNNNIKVQKRQRRRRRKLPIVNAAALLDAQTYCKKSAYPGGIVTRSGTEAAKRLLRGKKDLLDMLRGVVILQQGHRPFCLAGHGVPKQLLQDHINMADSMLRTYGEPAEISFRNYQDDSLMTSRGQHPGSASFYQGIPTRDGATNTTSGGTPNSPQQPVAPDCIRIRGHDGKSRIWEWPPRRPVMNSRPSTTPNKWPGSTASAIEAESNDTSGAKDFSSSLNKPDEDDTLEQYQWEDQMLLFLTVMDRISSHLGMLGSTRFHEGVAASPAKHWTIKMYRGMAFPREVISRLDGEADEDFSPVPILEWSPFKRLSYKQPHFTIRLQGVANTLSIGSPANPVTLVFDACFEDDGSVVQATGS